MNYYLRFLKYLRKYWLYLIGVIVCMVIVSLSNVAVIPLVARLSEAIGAKEMGIINMVILATLGIYFGKGIFMYGQVYLSAFVAQGLVRDLKDDFYRKLQDFSLDFFSKWRTGDIISRTINDTSVMQSATVSSATEIIPNMLTLFSVIGYLLYLNWKLTVLSVVVLPVIIFTAMKFGEEMRRISRKAQRKTADILTVLHETISGIRVVKSFTMEDHEAKRFAGENEKSFWIAMREAALHATQTPLLTLIQAVAILSIVWYGSFQVVSGHLSPSNLIAFFTGIALLADPISKLSKLNVTIQKSIAAAERVFEVMDLKPTVMEKKNAVKLGKLDGSVEFRDVTFRYETKEGEVLKNVSVSVSPGEIIALVGPSGAGKTTFVNLIPRFYDPVKGSISVDGTDLKDCQIFSLRKQMGIVPQETLLFSSSIKENIAYGDMKAGEDRIIEAARMANAHDFITKLPQGYDTLVGERGLRLSGGQRQRIAIARALLRDPRILILDEATSSLDTESERLVQDALEKLMKGRTTFVIAHRLSTVRVANRILVFKDGAIIETGTHDELLNKGGLYKKLYQMQFRNGPAKEGGAK